MTHKLTARELADGYFNRLTALGAWPERYPDADDGPYRLTWVSGDDWNFTQASGHVAGYLITEWAAAVLRVAAEDALIDKDDENRELEIGYYKHGSLWRVTAFGCKSEGPMISVSAPTLHEALWQALDAVIAGRKAGV